MRQSGICPAVQPASRSLAQLTGWSSPSSDDMQTHRIEATWAFQALADETRLRVIRVLSSNGASCTAGQLAHILEKPVAHLSRHIQALQVAGLIRVERRGSWHDISIRPDHPASEYLCAAVLAMPDVEAVFAGDLSRLVALGAGAEGQRDQLSPSSGG